VYGVDGFEKCRDDVSMIESAWLRSESWSLFGLAKTAHVHNASSVTSCNLQLALFGVEHVHCQVTLLQEITHQACSSCHGHWSLFLVALLEPVLVGHYVTQARLHMPCGVHQHMLGRDCSVSS
jgi:hypothetical protein